MRGVNRVVVSGNVSRDIVYDSLPDGSPVASFALASDRHSGSAVVTAWVKVNVYLDSLVRACRERLSCGGYVVVDGELMNREGRYGKLTEVRAKDIVFVKPGKVDADDQ